ncbi:hypothetical protein Pcinc_024078 [Petrolisthes cinctipes]|uniref:Ig-like domain-containing protein n=1 Tax=Petrolisthes cinctipes TaxID=88211 RepID=A0AAE1KEX4_PETCI|nr:hypothetical protein Pcinc_024078 [Petrolisthes cinctipes]
MLYWRGGMMMMMVVVVVLVLVVAADLASAPGRNEKMREEGEAVDRRSRDVEKRTQPHFDPQMSTNVTSLLGQTAVLNCRVRNIGNKTVSWIRHRDLHLLAVGRHTYTTDDRGQKEDEEDVSDWQLVVESVQPRDTGLYECQISTSPPLSHLIHLSVVEAQTVVVVSDDGDGGGEAESDGAGGVYLRTGDRLVLHCSVTHTPAPPTFVLWYHGNTLVSYERTKGRREEGRRKEGARRTGGNGRGVRGGGDEERVGVKNNAWQNGREKTKREGKEEDWRRMKERNKRENSWKGEGEWREKETAWKNPREATWKDAEEATWKGREATWKGRESTWKGRESTWNNEGETAWNNGREATWNGKEAEWTDEGESDLNNERKHVLTDGRGRSTTTTTTTTTRTKDEGKEVVLNDEGRRTTWRDEKETRLRMKDGGGESSMLWGGGETGTSSRLVINPVLPHHSGKYTCSPSNSRPASLHVTVVKGDKTAAILHDQSSGAGITAPLLPLLLLLLPFLMLLLPLNHF